MGVSAELAGRKLNPLNEANATASSHSSRLRRNHPHSLAFYLKRIKLHVDLLSINIKLISERTI
jgi:hypothetical protein